MPTFLYYISVDSAFSPQCNRNSVSFFSQWPLIFSDKRHPSEFFDHTRQQAKKLSVVASLKNARILQIHFKLFNNTVTFLQSVKTLSQNLIACSKEELRKWEIIGRKRKTLTSKSNTLPIFNYSLHLLNSRVSDGSTLDYRRIGFKPQLYPLIAMCPAQTV